MFTSSYKLVLIVASMCTCVPLIMMAIPKASGTLNLQHIYYPCSNILSQHSQLHVEVT